MNTSTIRAGIVPAALTCLLTLVSAGGGSCADETPSLSPSRPVAADGELRLFLAGDAIITQPWSADRAPDFLALVDEIRGADAAVVNLEMLFHTYKGYAQADSGGTYMAADPEIAAELAWAGVDMVANANNHTFDYGSLGVLENLDNVAKAGLVLAGAGKDLQSARAPAYFPHADGTVALVSAASSFVPYGKASRSRPDMHGRPGLNPLTAKPVRYVALPNFLARGVRSAAILFDLPYRELDAEWSRLYGLHIRVGDGLGLRWGRRIDSKDLADNLTSVREAAAKADLVVFSIHAHEQGRWLTDLAHRIIDAGADVFFAHGPHRMLGIEIYKDKPIFYGLGDFVFQQDLIERFPSEFYDRFGLGNDATPADIQAARAAEGLWAEREAWEAVAAMVRFKGGKLREVRLLPLDLGFGQSPPQRGTPRYADGTLGRRIISYVGDISRPYGTVIRYVEGENTGLVISARGEPLNEG